MKLTLKQGAPDYSLTIWGANARTAPLPPTTQHILKHLSKQYYGHLALNYYFHVQRVFRVEAEVPATKHEFAPRWR